jgi:hypothetical protein
MKKLKLDLDQIQVISFTAETMKSAGGTVNGFSGFTTSDQDTEFGWSCRYCQIALTEFGNC